MPRNPAAFSDGVFCLAERIKKMNSENDDVGIQTVQEIYNSLQVDEEWSIREERGFTWWANQGKLRDVYVFMRCSSNFLIEITTFEIVFSVKPATKANINRYPPTVQLLIRPAAVLWSRCRAPGPGWPGSGRL